MSENIELPSGWSWSIVRNIAKNIQYGFTKSSSKIEVGPKFLRITDIQDNKVNWPSVPFCEISDSEKLAYLLDDGDLVFARTGATVGKSFLLKGNIPDAIFASYLIRLRFPKSILDKYVWYFFQSPTYWKQIGVNQVGTGQPNVNGTVLGSLKIPISPFSEQHRIVSKIEELFSSLDKGVESLKLAQQQLKVYRQAVLKWAFEGKLTNENIRDGELPEGWKYFRIDEIASVGTGATPLKSNKLFYEGGQIPWVTSGALNNKVVSEASDFVTEQAIVQTNLTIYPKGTLLVAMYGEGKTRGKCSELLFPACTNQAIAAIHFDKHDIRYKPYLKYFLLKNYYDIRRLATGGVQPNLNLGIVKSVIFPAPSSFSNQQAIVSEIERRLSICDKIEESIEQSLQQAEALRQSILKKAFEGKLVPQDPTDEPASVLLERIHVESEKTAKPGNVKKTKNSRQTELVFETV